MRIGDGGVRRGQRPRPCRQTSGDRVVLIAAIPLKPGLAGVDNYRVRNDVLAGPRPLGGRGVVGRVTAAPDRLVALGVGFVAVLRGLPFVLMGPKFVLDDWFTLFWAWRDGWWRAAGPTQPRARPLGALLYIVEFGVIGRHPGVIAATQLVLTGVTAVLVFALGRRFMPRAVAAGVAVTWVLLPNHTALDHWASGLIAEVGLALLLAGALLLVRAEDRGRVPWAGTLLLGLSALSYEATIVAAVLAVVALPLLSGRRLAWRRVAWQLAVVAGVGA